MLALLAFTSAIFVGPEVAAPPPKATAPVVSNIAASTPIGTDFLVAFASGYSVDVQRISGTTGKPLHDGPTTLGTHRSLPVSVAIASNGRNAIVAWCLQDWEIFVALVDADGKLLTVHQRRTNNALHVAVATVGDRYLLVVQAADAVGYLLDATTAEQIGNSIFNYPRTTQVSAASNGDTALVTFIGDRIVSFLASRDAAKAGPIFTGLADNLRSAWDGSAFAIAWNRPKHVVVAKVAADGSIIRYAADFADTDESVAAVAGPYVVLDNRTAAIAGAIVPLPVDVQGSVVAVTPNGATNLALFTTPQLTAAVTNFVDPSTAVPVALTSSQSSPAIAAGRTQFFAGWMENERDVVARFADDSFSSSAALPLGQIGVAAVEDAALALTLDATTLTTNTIATDGTLLHSIRIAEGTYAADARIATLQRSGDLFGALLTPKPEFLVLSDRALITDVPLPAFRDLGSDLTAVGDHWVAGYYSFADGNRFDDLNYLGRTIATRAAILQHFPAWTAIAADDRGELLVALPIGTYTVLFIVDARGKTLAIETLYDATLSHVAWSGSEFVVVTEGREVQAWVFDRDGNMAANPVTIPTRLPPRDLRLAAGPAGIAIAYVHADAEIGGGDRVFVRQLRLYIPHGRPAR